MAHIRLLKYFLPTLDSPPADGDTVVFNAAEARFEPGGQTGFEPKTLILERSLSNQTLTDNTLSTIVFDTIERDDGEVFQPYVVSDTIFTFFATGVYSISLVAFLTRNGTGARYLELNFGYTEIVNEIPGIAGGSGQQGLSVSKADSITVGGGEPIEDIRCRIKQNSGGPLDMTYAALTIVRLS